MQHQFAERAQDQEHEDAADPIDQEQTGPRRCKAAAGAEKKVGTDGTTESDHLQLPAMEAFVIARVFAREPLVGDV